MKRLLTLPILATIACQLMFPVYSAGLKSAKDLREEITSLETRASAIAKAAKDDDRDLTDDEAKEVDSILGRGTPGSSDFVAGRLQVLKTQLERAEKIEKNEKDLAAKMAGDQTTGTGAQQRGSIDGNLQAVEIARIGSVRLVKPLAVFTGPNGRQEAFRAGQWYGATVFGIEACRQYCVDNGISLARSTGSPQAAQSGGTDNKGGYLLPNELSNTIIEQRSKYGVFRQYADVTTMASDTKDHPKKVGGPTASWMGATGVASEGASVTETDQTYGNVQLVANKIGALLKYSSEFDQDAIINAADDLTRDLAWAFAKKEDETGFLGDGSAGYGGFTGLCGGLTSVYTLPATKDTYAEFISSYFDGIIAMVSDWVDENNCAWFVSKTFYSLAMAPIIDAAGGNSGLDIATGDGRRVRYFKSFPVVFSSVFPKVPTSLADQYVGVFGSLLDTIVLGDRKVLELRVSDQAFFTTDQIAIRGIARAAIKIANVGTATEGSAIAIKMGSAT